MGRTNTLHLTAAASGRWQVQAPRAAAAGELSVRPFEEVQTMTEQSPGCIKCGGPLVAGAFERWQSDGENYYSSDLDFIIPGVPTSWNPIKAFRQGMAGEKEDERFKVMVWRCSRCGFLELYAGKPGQK
jgi:hypothetical protein